MKLMIVTIIFLICAIIYMSDIVYKEGMHDIKQYEIIENLENENYNERLFSDVVPKPSWFNDTKSYKLRNDKEVTKLWQSEKRCCNDDEDVLKNRRIFYKSCYEGIVDNQYDEDLVVKCLWLMDYKETEKTNPLLGKYLYENYFYHNNKIDDCVNCSIGDTVARAIMDYAYIIKDSYLERSIEMLERLIDERENDISNWVKIDLYEKLAYFYLNQESVSNIQIQRMKIGVSYIEEKAKSGNEKRDVLKLYNTIEALKDKNK